MYKNYASLGQIKFGITPEYSIMGNDKGLECEVEGR